MRSRNVFFKAVAKTVGKGYDRVSAAATKVSNKIDDISAKSRQSISNMFGKATTKLGSEIDDIGLKARSLTLKHVEIPSLAMAGGGNAGRPIKVPIGVEINEKKLEKLRQMKVEQGIKTGKGLEIASPNYKPFTGEQEKILKAFDDFDETKPFIKTVENQNGTSKYTVHAYDPGPPPMAFEKQTAGINFGLKGQSVTKSVNGNDVTIKYNENGFPIFDDHVFPVKGKKTVEIRTQDFINMNHTNQKEFIKNKYNLKDDIYDNYILHHREGVGEIQLVDKTVHEAFRHIGGMSIWGVGH